MATKTFYTNSKFVAKTFTGPKPNKTFSTHCSITGHVLENCFKSGNAEPPVCSHSHMTGHVAEKCYKLHGYRPGHKQYGKTKFPTSNAAIVESNSEQSADHDQVVFTKQQYQQLLHQIEDQDSTSHSPSVNHAQTVIKLPSGTPKASKISGIVACSTYFSKHTTSSSSPPWIIVSGTTDHMICCPSFFTTITSEVSYTVRLLNCAEIPVTHISYKRSIAAGCHMRPFFLF